jgi:hypothetical protein
MNILLFYAESLSPVATTAEENISKDEKDEEQIINPMQKKEDAKVEKELDRVTDRFDEEEIGSENIGNVNDELFNISFDCDLLLGINSN